MNHNPPFTIRDVIQFYVPQLDGVCDHPARIIRVLCAYIEGRVHTSSDHSAPDHSVSAHAPPNLNAAYYFFHEHEAASEHIVTQLPLLIARLQHHEPLSKIIGQREFFSRRFFINKYTLDPRPATEVLIEGILTLLPSLPRPLRILDLGTGSGCILLTLIKEIQLRTDDPVQGVGIDLCPNALDIARQNALSLGLDSCVTWMLGSWCTPLNQRHDQYTFSCIVSNPPYIKRDEVLDPSVLAYDPDLALFAGHHGTEAYDQFIPQLDAYTAPGGYIGVEFGQGQAQAVAHIFHMHGWESCSNVHVYDLQNIERCAFMRRIKT